MGCSPSHMDLKPGIIIILAGFLFVLPVGASPRPKDTEKQQPTILRVHTGIADCRVDVDGAIAGKTDSAGNINISDPESGDHYVHAECPKKPEMTEYISLPTGRTTTLELAATAAHQNITPLQAAENKIRLRKMVLKAVEARAKGEFDEAVSLLHQAALLDPSNSDLHRELGITFLLNKDWERARVEMIEAIRHDPGDADAHNGLGYALEKLGQLKQALAEYRTATKLDPTDDSYREHYYDVLSKLAAQQSTVK